MEQMICENLSVGRNGNLYFAGQDTAELAAKYGTPLYLMDEQRIRERCRTYLRAMQAAFPGKSRVLYAAKAAAFKRIFAIMREEGMDVDIVSSGELHTALKAGFPAERMWLHSNNKTDEDLEYAIANGVGCIVADNLEELAAADRIAARHGVRQKILLRLTPGIDPHTFAAVATGKVDSKFGFGIETGAADEALQTALRLPNLDTIGFHCHVGSQLFDSDVYIRSAELMLHYMAKAKREYGFVTRHLDLGGGYGVRYVMSQPTIDLSVCIAQLGAYVRRGCAALELPLPTVGLEPGRSIVADAGLTLYTVGMVKKIPGFVNYVSVDGGMSDNPRYALYGAEYTVLPATRMNEPREQISTVVGRCCESGDVIQPDVPLPATMARGDLLAVCTTGAYNYSMASNYNRIPRPPVVMVNASGSYVAVRRETWDDLIRLDE